VNPRDSEMNFYFTCAQLHSSRRMSSRHCHAGTEVSLAPLGEAKEKKIVLGLATLRPGSSGRMNANASGMAAYHQCPLASLTSLLYGTEALNDVSDVDHPVILFVSLTEADQVTIHLLTKPTNLARTNTDATIKHESNRGLGKVREKSQGPGQSDSGFFFFCPRLALMTSPDKWLKFPAPPRPYPASTRTGIRN
jgi:hypothetical protein